MSKFCSKCNQTKLLSDFGKHKGRKLGLADHCKTCRNQIAILQRFNITQSQKESMLIQQNYCCAICKVPQSTLSIRLAVDHCHIAGKIRGLLCCNCNHALGKFKDKIEFLQAAIDYLIKSL